MRIARLWLTDIRNHAATDVSFAPGLTVVTGDNGHGKTNLVEAIDLCATLSSFRGAGLDAVVRSGAESGVVRAEVVEGERHSLIEIEITPTGRTRAQVNRQPLRRTRDLLGALRTTVFGPDDLDLVKGGPSSRRRYLDDLLVSCLPRNDEIRRGVDRVLRQRNTLLRQMRSQADEGALATLDVWDAQLVELGTELARRRRALTDELTPRVQRCYAAVLDESSVSGGVEEVGLAYDCRWWDTGLGAALVGARRDELRRGVSLVGPHRDDLDLTVAGLPARSHASQGQQRSLALALRLAGHEIVAERTGTPPVVLLDDVLSELDPDRTRSLLAHLPEAQVVLTTAGPIPGTISPDLVLRVVSGRVSCVLPERT